MKGEEAVTLAEVRTTSKPLHHENALTHNLGPLVFLSVLFTHSAQAQRVMPYYDCDGGVNAMVEYNGQLVLGGSFLGFNGHERRNLQGWDGTAHFDYPEAFDDVNFIVTDMVVFNGDLIVAGWDTVYHGVARWDGSGWQPMGTAFQSGRAYDLAY